MRTSDRDAELRGPERTDHPPPDRTTPGEPAGAVDGVLGAAVISSGLLAGLVFDWALGVMPALTAADDRTLVDAMQRTVDNPVFPLTFLVAGGFLVAALVRARRSGPSEIVGWITAGLVLYAVAVLVTMGIHVPLNEELKDAGAPDRIADIAAVRDDFAGPWVDWNALRALTTTAAFGCVAWALVLRGRTR